MRAFNCYALSSLESLQLFSSKLASGNLTLVESLTRQSCVLYFLQLESGPLPALAKMHRLVVLQRL